MGADAEQWTARALHALGPLWHIEHNVPFPERGYMRDVDHIAVGPYGVLAVETKWTSATVDLGAKRLATQVEDAMRHAEDNAVRVRGLLHRVADVDVIPVVVFWGRDVKAPADHVRREGRVRIVAGREADDWGARLKSDRLDAKTVILLSNRVHGWLVEQEQMIIGAALQRRLRQAKRLGLISMALTVLLALLFPAAGTSPTLDRSLATIFRQGGGSVGVVIFSLPLILALLALAYVHLARRLSPGVPWSLGIAPLILWCAGFVAMVIATS